MCVESLRSEGFSPVGFWANPNIHPYTEYKNRLDTLKKYAEDISLPLVSYGEYGLRHFLREVEGAELRCEACYALRLDAAARYAAENGFPSFTTTLLISPFQEHDLLCEIMEKSAAKYGVSALFRDFRPLFREGQRRARLLGLYMQRYCGCILSEEERYLKIPPPVRR